MPHSLLSCHFTEDRACMFYPFIFLLSLWWARYVEIAEMRATIIGHLLDTLFNSNWSWVWKYGRRNFSSSILQKRLFNSDDFITKGLQSEQHLTWSTSYPRTPTNLHLLISMSWLKNVSRIVTSLILRK